MSVRVTYIIALFPTCIDKQNLCIVFPPTSDPTSWLIDTGNSTTGWKEWSSKHMASSMDRLEKTVRAFGGGAKEVRLRNE